MKQKENFLYEEYENRQERRHQSYNRYRRKSTEFIKVKVNGTLNDVSSYKWTIPIDFENLTGSFGLKHRVIIILKSWV